jgi:anti-anti-sigma regulatory factor
MLKVHAQKYGDVTIICLRGGVVTGDIASRIDAGGLGVLLELREHLQSRGIRFSLMNITELVQKVLEISHLNSVFEVLSEAEVLTAAAGVVEIEVCA